MQKRSLQLARTFSTFLGRFVYLSIRYLNTFSQVMFLLLLDILPTYLSTFYNPNDYLADEGSQFGTNEPPYCRPKEDVLE